MLIEKLLIKNYKFFSDIEVELNSDLNVFVGDNDTGKSTLMEALSIVTTGKINGNYLEKLLNLDHFNSQVRNQYVEQIREGKDSKLPIIVFEVYCKNDSLFSVYKGTNNTLGIDTPGIHLEVKFDNQYADDYKELVRNSLINDIPIEYYNVDAYYFSGTPIDYRKSPFYVAFVDTTKNNYNKVIDNFINENIAEYLTPKDRADLSFEFRNYRSQFSESELVKKLNKTLESDINLLKNRNINIDMREENRDSWKSQMAIKLDNLPFESLGLGTRNTVKIELALRAQNKLTNILMIEEPENNLSYSNMNILIDKIYSSKDKQVFISTHSSFVSNKIGLDKITVLHNRNAMRLNNLPKDTMRYFMKLPGYDTLRLVLARKVILVEGPSDELIVQRAYKDCHGKLPIQDGVDVITVDSLAFKRYLDVAVLIKKHTVVITDNDGNIQKNIFEKYSDYHKYPFIEFTYENDESRKTLEPSIAYINNSSDDYETFASVITRKSGVNPQPIDEILAYMSDNKTEWSLRVFESDLNIKYPEYIINAIK